MSFDHDFLDDHPLFMKIFDNRADFRLTHFIDYHVQPKL